METSAAHTCIKCDKYIHVLCGTSCEEGLLCPNCKVDSNRVRHRSGAMDSQLKQANTMVARSKKELGTPAIGQTVAVPIPTFDRGKGDSYLEKSRITNRNTTYKQFGKCTCD